MEHRISFLCQVALVSPAAIYPATDWGIGQVHFFENRKARQRGQSACDVGRAKLQMAQSALADGLTTIPWSWIPWNLWLKNQSLHKLHWNYLHKLHWNYAFYIFLHFTHLHTACSHCLQSTKSTIHMHKTPRDKVSWHQNRAARDNGFMFNF